MTIINSSRRQPRPHAYEVPKVSELAQTAPSAGRVALGSCREAGFRTEPQRAEIPPAAGFTGLKGTIQQFVPTPDAHAHPLQ
jgi:hypothetical protein